MVLTLVRRSRFGHGFLRRFSTDPSRLEWPSNRVRRTFIDYFSSLGYTFVQASSLVPYGDHSLLYVNAGMNQFKPIFLGTLNPTGTRVWLRLMTNDFRFQRNGLNFDWRSTVRNASEPTFGTKTWNKSVAMDTITRFSKCWVVGRSVVIYQNATCVAKLCAC